MKWQRSFHASKARYRIACIGRRGGKSEAAMQECVMFADQRPNSLIWWVGPSYDQARIGLEKFLDAYPANGPHYRHLVQKIRKSDPITIFFNNGSRIEFRSADKPRGLRGRGVHKLVCDEAAYYPDEVWHDCLSPTLLDTGGEAVLISTPGEKNWYYDLYQMGLDPTEPDYASFHATSYDNTSIPEEERFSFLEEKKRNTPSAVFRREYMAEFLEEDSEVFRGVKDCIDKSLPVVAEGNRWFSEGYQPGGHYVCGVDVAIHTDFTVFIVLKVENLGGQMVKRVVYLERIQKLEFEYQAHRLNSVWKDYNQPKIVIDVSGKGDSFATEVYKHIPRSFVTEVIFTSGNKQNYILSLAAEIEQGRVVFPTIPVLEKELLQYGWKKTATGHYQYSAPGKRHDDTVIALCLAISGAKNASQVRFLNGSQRAALLGI